MPEPPSTKPSDIDRLLNEIGWTRAELARRLNVSEATVRGWAIGRRAPLPSVFDWLQKIAHLIRSAPAFPEGWQRAGP